VNSTQKEEPATITAQRAENAASAAGRVALGITKVGSGMFSGEQQRTHILPLGRGEMFSQSWGTSWRRKIDPVRARRVPFGFLFPAITSAS
jgi:hypothetical protein